MDNSFHLPPSVYTQHAKREKLSFYFSGKSLSLSQDSMIIMRNNILYLICLIGLTVGITACHHHNDEPVVPNSRTVLVYVAGENTLAQLVSKDLAEMEEGIKKTNSKTDNLLVYIDDRSQPRLIHLTTDKSGNATQEVIESYTEQNSVDPTVMRQIIDKAFKTYPADSYGIVFWSHGEAWIPAPTTRSEKALEVVNPQKFEWWGADTMSKSYLDITDLASVLKSTKHLAFLFFDACYMLNMETAYELRSYGDYFIGCPTEIPGPGAPYQNVIPALFDKTDNVGKNIANAYFSYYNSIYNNGIRISNDNWTGGVSIGAIKLNELEKLGSETAKTISSHIKNKETIDTEGIYNFDQREATLYYHDFKEFMEKLTNKNSEYTAWKSQFDKAMVYWASTPANFSGVHHAMFDIDSNVGGVSVYIPHKFQVLSVNNYFHTIAWYKAAGWDKTGW